MEKPTHIHPAIEAEKERLYLKTEELKANNENLLYEVAAKKYRFVNQQATKINLPSSFYQIQRELGMSLKMISLIIDEEARRLYFYLIKNKHFNKLSAFCPDNYRYFCVCDGKIWIYNENMGWSYYISFDKKKHCEVYLWNAKPNDLIGTDDGCILRSSEHYINEQLLPPSLYYFFGYFSHAIDVMDNPEAYQ